MAGDNMEAYEVQLVILHALLSAGWDSDEALVESIRLTEEFISS